MSYRNVRRRRGAELALTLALGLLATASPVRAGDPLPPSMCFGNEPSWGLALERPDLAAYLPRLGAGRKAVALLFVAHENGFDSLPAAKREEVLYGIEHFAHAVHGIARQQVLHIHHEQTGF